MENVFVCVKKVVNNAPIQLLQNEERLPIFLCRADAEREIKKINRDAPILIRYTVRKINFKALLNLIK